MIGFRLDQKEDLNILCLGAHCDDIEIGCGGTILKIIENYQISHFKWVIFTSNEIRKEEATLSAEMFLQNVKSKEIIIKEYRDGFLPFLATEVKDYFEELKRAFNPIIIFTHYRDDRHQDHRLVSDLTWNTWRDHLILEYEIPKYDGDLGIPNFFVPLEEKYIKKRNEIVLKVFKSQASKQWLHEDIFTSLPRLRGMESVTKFAEAFYARKILF